MTNTLPKRIIIFASANEGFILDSIFNALSIEKISQNVKEITILYDNYIESNIDIQKIENGLSSYGINIDFIEVPIMNDLLENEFKVKINDGDCFVLSGTQLHISLIKNKIQQLLKNSSNNVSAYLCLIGPEGKTVHWLMINGNKNKKIKADYRITAQENIKSLVEYFHGDVEFQKPKGEFNPNQCRRLVQLESTSRKLGEFSEKICEQSGKKPGFAFEEISADYLSVLDNVAELLMNFKLKTEWKFRKGKDEPVYLEEDLILLTKKSNVIVISCKFWQKNSKKMKDSIREEISRLEVLRLPIKIPKERFQNILLTTTMAVEEIDYDGPVIVTNLREIAEKINHL